MTQDEDARTPRDRKGAVRRQLPEARRRRAAAEIEKRTAWLNWRIVRWAGAGEPAHRASMLDYRSAEEVVAGALQRYTPGLYALDLVYAGLNPEARSCRQITRALLARTLEALQGARRYPKQLLGLVGEPEAWRQAREKRLQQLSELARKGDGVEVLKCGLQLEAIGLTKPRAERDTEFLREYRWAHGAAETAEVRALGSRLLRAVERIERETGRGQPCAAANPEAKSAVYGLAGRASAFASPALVADGTAAWLETCRGAGNHARFEEVCWKACRSLECWLEAAGWKKRNIERLLELLPSLCVADWTEARYWSWTRTWEAKVQAHRMLGAMGDVPREQAQRLVRYGLLEAAGRLAQVSPQRLRILAGVPEGLLALSADAGRIGLWELLLGLPGRRADRRLLRFLEPRAERSQRQAVETLHDILLLPDKRFRQECPEENDSPLRLHFWLFEELVRRHPWGPGFRSEAACLFDLVRLMEKRSNEAALRKMAIAYLEAPFLYTASRRDLELCAELAGGDALRFLGLVRTVPGGSGEYPAEAPDGWSYLRKHPQIQSFLIECLQEKELAKRVWHILARMALALRMQLHEEAEKQLTAWLCPPPAAEVPDATPAIDALAAEVAAIAHYRALVGEKQPLPKRIVRLMYEPERRRRELESLQRQRQEGSLTAGARVRLAALEKERRPFAGKQAPAKLQRACRCALREARLRALETALDCVIRVQWRRIDIPAEAALTGPEWDHAFQLYAAIQKNRRILRRLLVKEAAGGRDWIRRHPVNVAWVESAQSEGVNVERWMEGARVSRLVNGAKWEVYTEKNPLQTLQMGSLFTTCLRPGGGYAYSAVANAVEVNKQVLYLRCPEAGILGRKLIALGRPADGPPGRWLLVGFRSYGCCETTKWSPRSGGSPWVKILFDLACEVLARETGAEFSAESDELWSASRTLALFAHWYNDGPEPPDWWTGECEREDFGERVVQELEQEGREPRSEQTIRALLYLGESAIPILRRCGPGVLQPKQWAFFAYWTQSEEARRVAAGWAAGSPASAAAPCPPFGYGAELEVRRP